MVIKEKIRQSTFKQGGVITLRAIMSHKSLIPGLTKFLHCFQTLIGSTNILLFDKFLCVTISTRTKVPKYIKIFAATLSSEKLLNFKDQQP